ncbi:MAG TPA: hypothetical protein VF395_06735 [Polyangiaceae bacterium]
MPLVLFDTARGTKENFSPRNPRAVRVYSCGPTVDAQKHLGDLRPYVVLDVLKRRLAGLGASVGHVMNITDFGHRTDDGDAGEDRVERTARRAGRTVPETVEHFTRLYRRDLYLLRVQEPTVWAKASEHIVEQVAMIRALEARGLTYRTKDGLYFDTRRDPRYGRFPHVTGRGKVPLRVVDGSKRESSDFAVWKFAADALPGQTAWDSPWGRGFPGWHIECSAMAATHLGSEIDLHTGSVDHIHAHHENEAAQSEHALGVSSWVRHWLHVESVTARVPGGAEPSFAPMSAFRGNACTLDDALARGISPRVCRLFLLGTHYRRPARFTWEGLEARERGYDQLVELVRNLDASRRGPKLRAAAPLLRQFEDAIDDDLDTPKALSLLFRTLHHPDIAPGDKLDLVTEMDGVLALDLVATAARKSDEARTFTPAVMRLVEERNLAQAARDLARMDAIRLELNLLGFRVEDHAEGTRIRAERAGATNPASRGAS